MKLLIVTPLFPPDVADPAPYVKELATRLANEHTVTVLAYGSLPEHIESVTFLTIPKRLPTFLRLLRCTLTLLKAVALHERVLIHNGASTELPAYVVSLIYKNKLRLLMSDHKVTYTDWRAWLHKKLIARIATTNHDALDLPLIKPEVLPFADYPTRAFLLYEASWQQHLATLTKLHII